MSRVLIIGDTHCPSVHPGYLAFVRDLRDTHKCDTIVHIGDVCDFHSISFHARSPDAPGPKTEYELTHSEIQKWHKVFPKAKVCVGNHDNRVIRLAESVNIPKKFLRDHADVWETPGWEWKDDFIIDDVYYFHGEGTGGIHPAFNSMLKQLMSVVQGHVHSAGGTKWRANPQRRIFGLDTGAGVDDSSYAFVYAKHQKIRSIISAAVVIDGIPQHIVAPIGPGEKYNRSRFKGKGSR